MNTYNLLVRLTDGSTESLEFTGQSPSSVAAAATRRVEVSATKRVEALAVLIPGSPAMVYYPRYEEWWHLLPGHIRKAVPEPDFGIETHKPLDPPSAAATEL